MAELTGWGEHAPFIVAAWAVALGGVLGLLLHSWWRWRGLRRRLQQSETRD